MPGKRESYLTWSEFSMGIALTASLRSKDPSTQVGAYIVSQDNKPLSIGYNGLTKGMDDNTFNWDSIGEVTGDIYTTKNFWVAHAEANAILNYKGNLEGSTIYVTLFPCNECAKLIIQAGIKKVVYLRDYNKSDLVRITKEMFDAANVEYEKYNLEHDFTKQEVKQLSNEIQNNLKKLTAYSNQEKTVTNLEIDKHFMEIARQESKYSTCRRQVGAVFVKDDKIITTGYNGSPIGIKSCQDDGGCLREKDNIKSGTMQEHCKAIHAEQRAIVNAVNKGIKLEGSTLYVTTYPCSICARMLIECKLKRIVYDGDYFDQVSHNMLKETLIDVEQINANKVKKIKYVK